MTISSKTHKSLTVIALALVLALLLALTLGTVSHTTHSQPGNTRPNTWSSARDSDPYEGGYHVARGRLLYQLEMHPPTPCIYLPRTQRIALGNLDTYITVDANGRASSGGQYVARQIGLRLGTLSAC